MPIAVFLPFSKLPSVSPSAPLTWPSAPGLPSVPGAIIAVSTSSALRSCSVCGAGRWDRRRPRGLELPTSVISRKRRADVIRICRETGSLQVAGIWVRSPGGRNIVESPGSRNWVSSRRALIRRSSCSSRCISPSTMICGPRRLPRGRRTPVHLSLPSMPTARAARGQIDACEICFA